MSQEATIIWVQGEGLLASTTLVTGDANTSVGATAPAEVTDYTLESGADASTHVILKPETLTLEFVQTEKPLPSADPEMRIVQGDLTVRKSSYEPAPYILLVQGIGDLIQEGAAALGLTDPPGQMKVWHYVRTSDEARIARFHDTLIDMRNSKDLMTVTVGGRSYTNYVITDVGMSQSGPEEYATFVVQMRRVNQAPPAAGAEFGIGLPTPADLALAAAKEAAQALLNAEDPSVEKIKSQSVDANKSILAGALGL